MSPPTSSTNRPPLALKGRLRRQATELVRLAVPVMVARAGLMLMVTVDNLVVARYSATHLAYLGLSSAVQSTLMAIIVGLLLGTIVMTAQAVGAGQDREVGAVFRRSIPYALLVGGIALVFSQFGEALFLLTGQTPDLARGSGEAMHAYGWGMPATALFITASFLLEGIKRPGAGMVATVIANIVNVFLDIALVFGRFGFPELGATGSAWATTIIRWGMAAGLIGYILMLPDAGRYGLRGRVERWRDGGKQRRLGYAAGLSNGLEASAFTGLSLFAGWLGPLALGAYTVGLNLIALPFMAALGLASATAVQVGTAHGAKDRAETALAGWTGLGLTALVLGVVGVFFALAPETIAFAFTQDPALILAMIPVVAFSAWILVVDGGQVVMAQALRGRGDTWTPTALHFFSYFAVMLPLCWTLAFPAGRGVLGLFEGIFVASVVSVAVLSARFWWLGRKA